MSLSSWKNDLTNALRSNPRARVALLGIGNELNGDDAAGVLAARRLKALPLPDAWLVIDAGVGPEAYTGVLRRFRPDLVLLVDAAHMDEAPGTIQVVDCTQARGFGGSTHTQPPSTLAEFLAADLGCRVLLVGIQPGQVDFDVPLTPAVLAAVEELAGVLREVASA